MRDLAPSVVRQRVIIECTAPRIVQPTELSDYLTKLSTELNMRPLSEPFVYPAEEIGYGGWIHWVTSGAHIYTYNTCTPSLLTVDAYTCKPFSAQRAADFKRKYFKPIELVWKEV